MSNSQIAEETACFFNKRVSGYEEHMKESYTYHVVAKVALEHSTVNEIGEQSD
jgi:hypothetical protein